MPLNGTFPRAVAFVTGSYVNDGGLLVSGVMGTSFIVEFPSVELPNVRYMYVVTAAHVVRPLNQSSIRLRHKDRTVKDWPVHEWFFHPTEDVAVTILTVDTTIDFRSIPVSAFMDKWDRSPALGDRVYFLGLLAEMSSMGAANIPMVRSGTLGALYQDDIPIEIAPKTVIHVTAHLIDCRSYGGFSGSPCFVQFPEIRRSKQVIQNIGGKSIPRPDMQALVSGETTLLLGIVIAHFDLMRDGLLTGDLANTAGGVEIPINSGVGVVLPVERVREALMLEELVAIREDSDKHPPKQPRPAVADRVTTAANFTRDDFEQALKKVAKKLPDSKITQTSDE